MANEIKKVDVFGNEVLTVKVENGDIYVPVKRLCEMVGIVSPKDQYSQIRDRDLYQGRWSDISLPSDGGLQKTFCLDIKMVTMFLVQINENKIKEENKEGLVKFQLKCADILHKAWFKKKTPAELHLEHAQLYYEQEQEMLKMKERQSSLESVQEVISEKIKNIEDMNSDAMDEIYKIPEPTDDVDINITLGQHFRNMVVAYCKICCIKYGDAYSAIYRRYTQVTHHGIQQIKRNKIKRGEIPSNYSIISLAIDLGVMEDLYNIGYKFILETRLVDMKGFPVPEKLKDLPVNENELICN